MFAFDLFLRLIWWCNDTQHNDIQHTDTLHKGLVCGTHHKWHWASLTLCNMLSVIPLNVMPSKMTLSLMEEIVILSVTLYRPFMLNVIMLNVIKLNVIILNVVILNVIILNVIVLNVVMLCRGERETKRSNYFLIIKVKICWTFIFLKVEKIL